MSGSQLDAIDRDRLVEQIVHQLERIAPRPMYGAFSPVPANVEPAAFALVVGAGFSYGVMPLVAELMCETIGDYYYPDQDQTSVRRPASVLRGKSADFWRELNAAATRGGFEPVALDRGGLPADCAAAYRELFAFDAAVALFAKGAQRRPKSFVEKMRTASGRAVAPEPNVGKAFVQGFLRYVLAPGSEHGCGFTGRTVLNQAHRRLGAILDAQQTGIGWKDRRPFCRTIFTTNFDTLLQVMLQDARLVPVVTDRPELGIDAEPFEGDHGAIHLVYTHGSILRHNPASANDQLNDLLHRNTAVLRAYLDSRDVIVVGYGGWNDSLAAAMKGGARSRLYWCDVSDDPPASVIELASVREGPLTYVRLGRAGADGLMAALADALGIVAQ